MVILPYVCSQYLGEPQFTKKMVISQGHNNTLKFVTTQGQQKGGFSLGSGFSTTTLANRFRIIQITI